MNISVLTSVEEKIAAMTNNSLLCNDTNITCKDIPLDHNIVSTMLSVLILAITMIAGTITNLMTLQKSLKHNWKSNFVLVQFLVTGFVACGIITPMQIIRIGLMLKHYEFYELCHFHQFIHLHVKGCTYLSTVIIAYERMRRTSPDRYINSTTKLTVAKVLATFSWILILPLVTSVIREAEFEPTAISVFSADCGYIHGNNGYLVESIGNYIFVGAFILTSLLYIAYSYRLWKKKATQNRRITQQPNMNRNSVEMYNRNMYLHNQGPRTIVIRPRSPLQANVFTINERQHSPSPKLEPITHQPITRSPSPTPSLIKRGKSCPIPKSDRYTVKSPTTSLRSPLKRTPRSPTLTRMNPSDFEMMKPFNFTEKDQTSPTVRTTKLMEFPFAGDSLPTEQPAQEGYLKLNHLCDHVPIQVQEVLGCGSSSNKDSVTSGITGTTSTKESGNTFTSHKESEQSNITEGSGRDYMLGPPDILTKKSLSDASEITYHESLTSGITGTTSSCSLGLNRTISILHDSIITEKEKKEGLDTPQKLRGIPKSKSSCTSFSEERSSLKSQLSVQSENEDGSTKLNPLRHTRVSPSNVWHPELAKSNSEIPPIRKPTSQGKSSRKKKKGSKKMLKKQLSIDSIGRFSMNSVLSEPSTLDICKIDTVSTASSYKYNARSIDSFLDEGLANILEQPEQEDGNMRVVSSMSKSDHSNQLALPEMRIRSNTGDIQTRHLQVNEDEFRLRAQSDLTEDKQKKLLETKKFQSLRNRKLTNMSESQLQKSAFSLSTDSSFSDANQDHDPCPKTRIKLITHNMLNSSIESIEMESTDCEKCPVQLPQFVRTSKIKESIIYVDSTTQTEDLFLTKSDSAKNRNMNTNYPIIKIIRPSEPDSGNLPNEIRNPNSKYHSKSSLNDSSPKKTQSNRQSLVEKSINSPINQRTICGRQNVSHDQERVTKGIMCCLILAISFFLFYMPTFLVTYLIDKLPNSIDLDVLVAARSIEYLYYVFVPKIYTYTDKNM